MNSEKRRLLMKVKITQLEMMRDRGYDISSESFMLESDLEKDIDEYQKFYESRIAEVSKILPVAKKWNFIDGHSNIYYHPKDGRSALVYYTGTLGEDSKKNLDKKSVTMFIGAVEKLRSERKTGIENFLGVMISQLPIQEQTIKDYTGNQLLQFFEFNELAFNPTKHKLSPSYRLLTREDTEKKLKQIFGDITGKPGIANLLPLIGIDDPISRYYHAQSGLLFEIRNHESIPTKAAPITISYRKVT